MPLFFEDLRLPTDGAIVRNLRMCIYTEMSPSETCGTALTPELT